MAIDEVGTAEGSYRHEHQPNLPWKGQCQVLLYSAGTRHAFSASWRRSATASEVPRTERPKGKPGPREGGGAIPLSSSPASLNFSVAF